MGNTRQHGGRSIARLVTLLLSAAVLITPASAQDTMSPAELRRALAQERARADAAEQRAQTLEAENNALRAEVGQLRLQIQNLGAGPQRVQPPSVAPPPNPTEQIPTGQLTPDPLGSPSSLFFAMQLSYERATSFDDLGREPTERELQRAVADWTRRVTREVAGNTEWVVRLRPSDTPGAPEGGNPRVGFLTVVDRATLAPIGSPIRVAVPTRFQRDLADATDNQLFLLNARVQGTPVFNPTRTEAGPFNFPVLIGPYAEFGFDLDWQRLRRIEAGELGAQQDGGNVGNAGGGSGR